MGIMFTNRKAGEQIFEAWRRRFGPFDRDEEIRVAILTGVDKSNPHAYKVIIGSNPNPKLEVGKLVLAVSRFNLMEPNTSDNLNLFLQQRQLAGSFGLAPIFGTSQAEMRAALSGAIGMRNIAVRPAWQVGEHDPDLIALSVEDDVIIPKGEKDAPFLRALARMKSRRDN
jgi:hypothetical protein